MSKYFTQLGNGMRVLTEFIPHAESVSLGIWLDRGSRFEASSENGLFHFIEHVLFKGTSKRNARQIAEAFDGMGGHVDAHTGKEETCFSFRLRAKHWVQGLEILGDMLTDPLFAEEDLTREKQVILEEINMSNDDPEDLVFEIAQQAFWPGNSLAQPILGTAKHVASFTPEQTRLFFNLHYQPHNMIVAAAGKLDHDVLCQKLEKVFPPSNSQTNPGLLTEQPFPTSFKIGKRRQSLEQVSFCWMFPGLPQTHPQKPALAILNTLLGGGMSSRLFQKVREESGLVYHIGSFTGSYLDAGYLTVYGSCAPENLEKVTQLAGHEIAFFRESLISEEELSRAREQCEGGLILALESAGAKAAALAKAMRYSNQVFDLEEKVKGYSTVQPEDILALSQLVFDSERMGFSSVGPLKGIPLEKLEILKKVS